MALADLRIDAARKYLAFAEDVTTEETPADCLAQLELELATVLEIQGCSVESAARLRSALGRLRKLPKKFNQPLRLRLHLGFARVELDHVIGGFWSALPNHPENGDERRRVVKAWRERSRPARKRASWHLRRVAPLLERHEKPVLRAQYQLLLGRVLLWRRTERAVDLFIAATQSFAALGDPETELNTVYELFGWLLALDRWHQMSSIVERLDPGLRTRLKEEGTEIPGSLEQENVQA